ncbi:uncharacterized protein V1518DRAFT_372029 [Limtongia smithiae]|uniref:uncharacterized protein n=1 Tax=Limtongia smithiae TaxID=1125753 RepID=UPI0034CFB361
MSSLYRENARTTTGVLESAKYISENSTYVTISQSACESAAISIYAAMQEKSYTTETWINHVLNPKVRDANAIDWIFLVDLLNFSFWSDADLEDTGKAETARYAINWAGQYWTGYWSLCAVVNRALSEGIPITTPSFWTDTEKCTDDLIAYIFRSDTTESVPMLQERISCMREAGSALVSQFGGRFTNCITEAGNSAVRLVHIVVDSFPCFRDESEYKGRTVQIYKRAQILVAGWYRANVRVPDIWACFNQTSYGKFDDIDKISMFADYRVPQILHTLGCLEYSTELTAHIDSLQMIDHNDEREVELRGCSIWSVEVIKQALLREHPESKINSVLLDFYLWDTAKELQANMVRPSVACHRTRSVFY